MNALKFYSFTILRGKSIKLDVKDENHVEATSNINFNSIDTNTNNGDSTPVEQLARSTRLHLLEVDVDEVEALPVGSS